MITRYKVIYKEMRCFSVFDDFAVHSYSRTEPKIINFKIFLILICSVFTFKSYSQDSTLERLDSLKYFAQKTEEYNGTIDDDPEKIAPTFQGGDLKSFESWVQKQIIYPDVAKDEGIEGRMVIQFTVDTIGFVKDIKTIRSIGDKRLDNEAVRIVNSSPLWTPCTYTKFPYKHKSVMYFIKVIFKM